MISYESNEVDLKADNFSIKLSKVIYS